MVMKFELEGEEFVALNGGSQFRFTEAISLVVNCKDQDDVDYYWDKLSEGGEPGPCGWLKDRFGLSWQIVPTVLGELMGEKDAGKKERVMKALMQIKKLDVEGLKRAAEEKN